MSEAEIIEDIERIIEFFEEADYMSIDKETSKSIQGLLDLYNKEKEKNKNLIAQLKDYEKELLQITQKYRELNFKYQARKDRTKQLIKEDYIPKSKVKEIIENSYPDIAVEKLYELLEGDK